MFALFAFFFLFGIVGLLLAVPLSAITATLIRYAVRRYKGSALYKGERPPRSPAPQPRGAAELPSLRHKAHATRQEMSPLQLGPAAFRLRPQTRRTLEDDFIDGEGNRLALAHIRAFPDWPGPLTLLEGPAKSGKSHLAADLGWSAPVPLADARRAGEPCRGGRRLRRF